MVIWFDGDGAYTSYVDARGGERRPQVLGYRGSFLELMLALEPLWCRTSGRWRGGWRTRG